MKKFNFSKLSPCGKLFKFDLKMKLTTLLFIVALFQIQANNTYSQNTKITLKLDNVSIEDVFKNIETLSEFKFLYNHKRIDADRKVSINFNKERISDILESLFSDTDIYFKVRKKQIILKTGKNKKPVIKIETSILQQTEIKGTITDPNGVPIPGVNILVVGTNKGTQTDFDGNYSINANDGDTLRFSFLGYSSVDVVVGPQAVYDLSMKENVSDLEEVVVVGYSTAIKKTITSSVASIKAEKLNEIPNTSLGGAIAGRIAGVRVDRTSGKPGRSSNINVRGANQTDFGGSTEPLYVIDGIALDKANFDRLDVSEVETVTVLKDAASAAVYGARAANGVILVTTKKGKRGAPVLNFTSNIGTTSPVRQPKFTSAYETALLINQDKDFNNAAPDDGGRINPEELEFLRTAGFKNFSEEVQETPVLNRYALTASGATENVNYFISGSHVKETGTVPNLDYKKTTFRAKVNVALSDNLDVSLNISTSNDLREEFYWRWNGGDEDFGDFYRTFGRNGAWGNATRNGEFVANNNGWNAANLVNEGGGHNDRKASNTNYIIDANYKIPKVKGLVAGFTYSQINESTERELFRRPMTAVVFGTVPGNRFELTDEIVGTRVRTDGGNTPRLNQINGTTETVQINARLKYDNTFGDHKVNAFFNYEQTEIENAGISAFVRNLLSESILELNGIGGADDEQFVNGSKSEDGRQSYIGAVGYNYKDKYLLNASFRYDGSVQFLPEQQFGFFPSVSAGWVASEEGFFKEKLGFFDFFKIRYSWGKTGNDDIGDGFNFEFIQNYNLLGASGPIFGTGTSQSNRISIQGLPNRFLTWSTQESYNFGLDFKMLSNKLSTTLDIFTNKRTDLFGNRIQTTPSTFGDDPPRVNYGANTTKGFEVLVNYHDNIGSDLSYEVGLNFSKATTKFDIIDEADDTRPHLIRTGQFTDRIFGYRALGIIRTQAQLDGLIADGYSFNGQVPVLGELYYADLRGPAATDPEANTPDGIVDDNDRTPLANHSSAPYNYGMTLGLSYKGFKLQAFLQGTAGAYQYRPENSRFTFASPGESSWTAWNDSWTPDNPNASYPRYNSRNNLTNSSFWLEKADFIRLKNLNIGYTLPDNVVKKIGVEDITLFANGTNLFMVYSAIKDYDPETSGRVIPLNKSYTFGVNITF